MKKIISVIVSVVLIMNINLMVYANPYTDSEIENTVEITNDTDEINDDEYSSINNIMKKTIEEINGLLKENDNDNNEQENTSNSIIELLKKIMKIISNLLDDIFNIAQEVIEVE